MADMFAPLVEQLKANPKTIVFTEGSDPRILEAASKLLAGQILKVVMVGNKAECEAAAAAGGFDISGAEIIDPDTYEGFDEMVNTMVELRKGKMTAEECRDLLKKSNYFGTMLVKMGKADCLLGGATYSTADTVRPALQLIKTKKGAHLVSSCFILDRDWGEEDLKRIAMGDCAINIDYQDTVDKATGEVKLPAALRHQHRLSGHRGQGHRRSQAARRRQAGRGRGGDCQDRQDLRHRPQGRRPELLHQGLGQGRHRGPEP